MGIFTSIKIGILIAVLALCAGGYYYVKNLQTRLDTAKAEIVGLNTAIQINEETVKSLQIDNKKLQVENRKLNEEFAAIRSQNKVLAKKLERHDIGLLGAAKPKLVEKIIDNASKKAGRCLELLSGAELTEKEKNATTGKKFNSECPWLFDDLNVAD